MTAALFFENKAEIDWRFATKLETERCHDANIFVSGGTGCCHQWRQSGHHDNSTDVALVRHRPLYSIYARCHFEIKPKTLAVITEAFFCISPTSVCDSFWFYLWYLNENGGIHFCLILFCFRNPEENVSSNKNQNTFSLANHHFVCWTLASLQPFSLSGDLRSYTQ